MSRPRPARPSTKPLYFLDLAAEVPAARRALVLDRRVARVLRAHATRVGLESGLPTASDVATRTWSDAGWKPYRYEVYLSWMTASAAQLSAAQLASSCLLRNQVARGESGPS